MLASLRSRLVLQNLVISLVGMLIIVVVFSWLLNQRGVDVREQELAKQSRAVAAEIEQVYAHGGSLQDLQVTIDAASRLLGERVIVVSPGPGSTVKADSAHSIPEAAQFVNPVALHSGTSVASLEKNLVGFQRPIRGTKIQGTSRYRNGGALILLARPADLRPNSSSLMGFILIAAGTTLLVWLLIGFYFAASIFRPLLRISQATERMARGDYSARAHLQGRGEIATLARSFNHMAEQVQRTNKLLRDFVANVSHDLRTPLTLIAGFSQALLDGTARADEAESSATIIHAEAARMQRLVEDLLQLTRLESGLFTLERHPVNVPSFVQDVVYRVTQACGEREIAVVRSAVPGDVPPMNVDAERLERVLRNLLDNAVQYTPPTGRVSVYATQRQPGWIEIAVSDTGQGIPQEDIPRIFERFFRSDKSRDRARGNSGLGLAIAREIIEAHGGTISVESQVGTGTTFRFTVPAAARAAADASPVRGPVQQTAAQ